MGEGGQIWRRDWQMGAVRLAGPVYRLPTLGDYINSFAFIEPDGSVTLVDCGIARAPRRIVAGLADIGKHPRDVQRIVLTHAHMDHAGGAAEVLAASTATGVAVHDADRGYIECGESAPGDPSSGVYRFYQRFVSGRFNPVPVERVVADGEVLDVAGGLTVHHTPGHTPGHISLLHEDTGVLITGDAIFNAASRMTWPIKMVCTSFPQNKQSAAKLSELDYQVAAFTHGPEIRDQAREKVRDFVRRRS
jgi:glyoxylase-like metal-dependent hydrolase (beta-lactamase superfamily II)